MECLLRWCLSLGFNQQQGGNLKFAVFFFLFFLSFIERTFLWLIWFLLLIKNAVNWGEGLAGELLYFWCVLRGQHHLMVRGEPSHIPSFCSMMNEPHSGTWPMQQTAIYTWFKNKRAHTHSQNPVHTQMHGLGAPLTAGLEPMLHTHADSTPLRVYKLFIASQPCAVGC